MKRKRAGLTAALLLLLVWVSVFAAAETGSGGFRTEEYRLERDGKSIYGKLYLPENAAYPLPLLILSHGLGSDHTKMEPYAEIFAENGFAAFVFDYIGGSEHSRSDGTMTEMSVLTEAEDLNCVLDHFLGDARFAQDAVFLFGGSQGGFISAYVAGTRPENTAGLILLYPAFNLQEICLSLIAQDGGLPDTAVIGKHTMGRIYLEDMLNFGIYDVLGQYPGPALLFHGTEDPYVPLAYSVRAAEALADAELVTVEGAGHGFKGEDLIRVAQRTMDFITDLLSGARTAEPEPAAAA